MGERTEAREEHLRLWDEVLGVYQGVEITEFQATLLFRKLRISFPVHSPEAEILKKLGDSLLGKRIGILKTDLREKPLVIRVLK